MKKRMRNSVIRFCIAAGCAVWLAFPAMAEEGAASGTAEAAAEASADSADPGASRVIVCGGGQTAEDTSSAEGPGQEASLEADSAADSQSEETGTKGESLGMFTTTGYCSCINCSGGHNLTYSGTVPQARHTISADINQFPIGTKLMIDDVIYTVEDMGSSVKGNWIDIYYATHEEAVAHGMKTQEVFQVIQ